MHKKAISAGLHAIILIGLLTVIAIQVHWAVAIVCAWLAVSIAVFVGDCKKLKKAIQAVDQKHENLVLQLNLQAEEMRKKLNTCHECEMHGKEGIRFGSLHNRNASNCLMNFEKNKV